MVTVRPPFFEQINALKPRNCHGEASKRESCYHSLVEVLLQL